MGLQSKNLQAYKEKYKSSFTQTDESNIRVLVIDTHQLARHSFQHIVDELPFVEDVESVGAVNDALRILETTNIHVIVLGISISIEECLHTIETVKRIAKQKSVPGIILIRLSFHAEMSIMLLKKGVNSLLDGRASEKDLANALLAAAEGSTFFSSHMRDNLSLAMSEAPIHLTYREIQVLSCLRRGDSNLQIARELGLKEKTVEAHLTNIYGKLRVSSRSEAILWTQNMQL